MKEQHIDADKFSEEFKQLVRYNTTANKVYTMCRKSPERAAEIIEGLVNIILDVQKEIGEVKNTYINCDHIYVPYGNSVDNNYSAICKICGYKP